MSAPTEKDREAAFSLIGYSGCNCPAETLDDPAMICKWCLLMEALTSVREEEREDCCRAIIRAIPCECREVKHNYIVPSGRCQRCLPVAAIRKGD